MTRVTIRLTIAQTEALLRGLGNATCLSEEHMTTDIFNGDRRKARACLKASAVIQEALAAARQKQGPKQ